MADKISPFIKGGLRGICFMFWRKKIAREECVVWVGESSIQQLNAGQCRPVGAGHIVKGGYFFGLPPLVWPPLGAVVTAGTP